MVFSNHIHDTKSQAEIKIGSNIIGYISNICKVASKV